MFERSLYRLPDTNKIVAGKALLRPKHEKAGVEIQLEQLREIPALHAGLMSSLIMTIYIRLWTLNQEIRSWNDFRKLPRQTYTRTWWRNDSNVTRLECGGTVLNWNDFVFTWVFKPSCFILFETARFPSRICASWHMKSNLSPAKEISTKTLSYATWRCKVNHRY